MSTFETRSGTYLDRCDAALELQDGGMALVRIADRLGVTLRSAEQMVYVARQRQGRVVPRPARPAPKKPLVPWHAEATKLRGKGWSVSGIARHLRHHRVSEADVAELFGVVWGGGK